MHYDNRVPITVQKVFGIANSCDDHPLKEPFPDEATETVVGLSFYDDGTWVDSMSFAIGKLSDGRFLVVMESSDSTGHGCQCSGSSSVHASLEDALRLGLGDEQRAEATLALAAQKEA